MSVLGEVSGGESTYMTAEGLSFSTEPNFVESWKDTKGSCNGNCHPKIKTPQEEFKFKPNKIVVAWKKQIQEFEKKEKKQNRCTRVVPKVDTMDPLEFTVAKKYRLIERIGNGSFGELYRARDLGNGEEVAAKVELVKATQPMLEREAKIYQILSGGEGIPQVRYYGIERDVNVLVLDLLGPTLEDLLNFCMRRFSLHTILVLAEQMLTRLEFVHLKCFVHRDIKPENFLMGQGAQRNVVYLIDFGLAKNFYSPCTARHIEYRQNRELVGTPRYASVRAHFSEQGRRDDLESLGYILVYFWHGRLPWQGIQSNSRAQKFEQIAEIKASTPLDNLCADLPDEFLMYLRYVRCLHFDEMPDYMYLRQMFRNLFCRRRRTNDFFFDWVDKQSFVQQQRDCVAKRDKHQIMKKNLNCCSCSYHKHWRRMDPQRGQQ